MNTNGIKTRADSFVFSWFTPDSGSRRPGAPQLNAPSVAMIPPTQTARTAHGDFKSASRKPLCPQGRSSWPPPAQPRSRA